MAIVVVVVLAMALSPAWGSALPDPKCQDGILEESSLVCCAKSCGRCGGPNCGTLPGGSADCCTGSIEKANRPCTANPAPCMLAPPKPPPTACGEYPQPLSTTQPNVLLIGDSISMPVPFTPGGYGKVARAALENHSIAVQHNGGWGKGGQASNTAKGLLCTNASTHGNWLNFTGHFDVIHFNFGLHDLVDAGPGEGTEHVGLEQYGQNLAEIYRRLAARAKHVVWAETTPCPNVTTSMGRTDAKARAYNAEALAALRAVAPGIAVDPLHMEVDDYCGANYKTCDLQLPGEHASPARSPALRGVGRRSTALCAPRARGLPRLPMVAAGAGSARAPCCLRAVIAGPAD